jgi:hypothetical protein
MKGWKSGYKSINWYTSGSTYVTISFGNWTQVSQIVLKQLSSGFVPFDKFKISYSNDGITYASLAEVSSVPL